MEKTVKKRQNKSQPLGIVGAIKAALGIGRAEERKAGRGYKSWRFGKWGKDRVTKGAFGKCKYLKRKKE